MGKGRREGESLFGLGHGLAHQVGRHLHGEDERHEVRRAVERVLEDLVVRRGDRVVVPGWGRVDAAATRPKVVRIASTPWLRRRTESVGSGVLRGVAAIAEPTDPEVEADAIGASWRADRR